MEYILFFGWLGCALFLYAILTWTTQQNDHPQFSHNMLTRVMLAIGWPILIMLIVIVNVYEFLLSIKGE